jgi:hypothetical protein
MHNVLNFEVCDFADLGNSFITYKVMRNPLLPQVMLSLSMQLSGVGNVSKRDFIKCCLFVWCLLPTDQI